MTILQELAVTDTPALAALGAARVGTSAALGPWDNRPSWDNSQSGGFDNRPTWDNWSNKK
jgi:hypothetical protein